MIRLEEYSEDVKAIKSKKLFSSKLTLSVSDLQSDLTDKCTQHLIQQFIFVSSPCSCEDLVLEKF